MLKGKTAVVTGSTSGIGLAVARGLAAQGADILINGFAAPGEADKLKAELAAEFGVKVAYHAADLSKPAEIEALFAFAEATFGGVDILCNNAGIQHTAATDEFPPENWDAIIAVNLSAPFHCTRLALPMMKKKGWGRIINTGSVHSLVASVKKAAYVAAKHGIAGLTKVVALENAGSGITCNGFAPGWVMTPLIQKQIEDRAAALGVAFDEARSSLLAEKQPSRTPVEAEQIAALVVFLCSPAADQITGTMIPIDGGWTAQ